jgi:spore coat polysaccharide biosynthesis predicted glycosyltransferase SpsG
MSLRALFLTEAGSLTGMGHLVRCSALADALAARGVVCEFWANLSGQPPAFDTPHRLAFRTWHGSQPARADELRQADFVVIDSYRADMRTLQAIADAAHSTLVLDDFAQGYPPQCIVLNICGTAEAYRHDPQRLLLGAQFVLLRAPFRRAQPPLIKPQIETVLVTLGGGDTARHVAPLVDRLRRLRPHWRVLALAAPGKASPQVEWHVALPAAEMAALMRRADLAISAGGQTLNELAALGVPTLALKLADNQAVNIENGQAVGFLVELGELAACDLEPRLAAALDSVEPPEVRANMSAAGRNWVDGRGAERVADFLLQCAEKGGI